MSVSWFGIPTGFQTGWNMPITNLKGDFFMTKHKVSEIAKIFGVSTTAIYKHLKRVWNRLEGHVSKEGKTTILDDEGFKILRGAIESARTATHVISVPAKSEEQNHRLEGIEKIMILMAEEIKNLRGEVSRLNLRLAPPGQPVTPTIPWQPEKPKDPVEGMAWYQRAWVECFEPWKMRKYAS